MRLAESRWARRFLAFTATAAVATGLNLVPVAAAPAFAGHPAASRGTGSPVTVRGPRLWNPATNKPLAQRSAVTVGQTRNLTDQFVHVSWADFTPSVSNAAGPYYTNTTAYYAVEAVECAGTNPTSPHDCYQANVGGYQYPSGPSGPPNNTYALSTKAGTGQLNFLVETSLVNAQLGCDQNRPCSLVIIPGQGGARANCRDHSADIGFAGTGNALAQVTFSFLPGTGTGRCSWNDRIVVPLHFAPAPSGCPHRAPAFSAAGSPMMSVAMRRWLPGLCAGEHGLTIEYDPQIGEPAAVQDVASGRSGLDVALTTRPASADRIPTGPRHFVYAPIAISAVSIDYWIDDNRLTGNGSGQPLTGLRLNQRLLAKLLTTSYNPAAACPPPPMRRPPGCDTGVYHDPFSVLYDRELRALNPAISQNILPGGFTNLNIVPTVLAGRSDMTWTVTRWIGADPAASSFLAGTFDPWGSHVNTWYLGLRYPTDTFTPRDPGTLWSQEYSPVYPLSQAVTYQALNTDAGSFVPAPPPQNGYLKDPPEPVGERALFAILDQGDAALDHFPAAAIPNAAGDYVQPSNAAMAAAVSHMTSDGDGTLQVNLRNRDPRAYPLTMVIYAMAPTSGLPEQKAKAIARFIDFAAGTGQRQGASPGQLPAGYLPLTPALRAQARKAAQEVAAQHGGG